MRLSKEAFEKLIEDAEKDGTLPKPGACAACIHLMADDKPARHKKCAENRRRQVEFLTSRAEKMGYTEMV